MESTTLELNGSGYGDGYGSGSGDGYGSGDDEEMKQYLEAVLSPHKRASSKIAFWRSTKDGTPANVGLGTAVATIGLTEEVQGPLRACTANALHGTLKPENWKGERWWIVALHEPFIEQEDKIASLKRTILADLGKCPF